MGWTDFLGAAEKLFTGGNLGKGGYIPAGDPRLSRLPGAVGRSSMATPYYLGAPDDSGIDFGLDSGLAGGGLRRRPRMNVMNSHAARRAVRRLRGALKLLHRIERTMPHRKCNRVHAGRRFGRR